MYRKKNEEVIVVVYTIYEEMVKNETFEKLTSSHHLT